MVRGWMASSAMVLGAAALFGQDGKPAAKTVVSGCVTRSAAVPDALVLRSKESCSQLAGRAAKDSLVGRQVTLEGMLSEATSSTPETLRVTAVTHVGEACSETCTLEPPGKRGLRKKEIPRGEGSTPGALPQPGVPPAQP